MRQIVTTGNGDIDVLKVQEKPDPTPRDDEVVIRVRAAGLNFADILARQGLYPDSTAEAVCDGIRGQRRRRDVSARM